jgi:hypothetical protein
MGCQRDQSAGDFTAGFATRMEECDSDVQRPLQQDARTGGGVDSSRLTQMSLSQGVLCATVTDAVQDDEPEVGTVRGGDGRIPIKDQKIEATSPRLLLFFTWLTATPLRGACRRSRWLLVELYSWTKKAPATKITST